MARKKTTETPMLATEVEMKFVRLQLPPEDHKLLRLLAANDESNMAIKARAIVQDYLARHRAKGGAK